MTVLLSGPITGVKNYRLNFAQASVEARRRWPGATVFNPAALPDDRDYDWYMKRCTDEIFAAKACGDAVMLRLKRWTRSKGARAETALAVALGIEIVEMM